MKDAVLWERTAPTYETQIFDVFKNDKHKKVKEYIKKHANKKSLAVDFGCGTGKALSLLSPAFKKVMALDISHKCIEQAKDLSYKNVEFKQADLSKKNFSLPNADFVFCCNVAISDNVERNYNIIKNGLKVLKKGAYAVFVLPSLESHSISAQRLIEWHKKDGVPFSKIPKDELEYLKSKDHKTALQGVVKLAGTPIKHYLLQELYNLLNSKKYSLRAIERLEYEWITEFTSPPKWMLNPYPFDWLVEVKCI